MISRPLSPDFHSRNRLGLMNAIGADAVAIIDTSDVLERSGDYEYPFHPDPNFYYLTGVAEPEAVLVLVPGHSSADFREILFTSGTSDLVGVWEGQRLTPEEASKLSGIKQVYTLSDLSSILRRILMKYQVVFLNGDQSLGGHMSSPSARRARQLQQALPLHTLRSALPQLATQRQVKDEAEIVLIREAIDLSQRGLKRAWHHLSPGVLEYELEAELTSEFIRHGATNAFLPIVAGGPNATIMHYIKNDRAVAGGELVLFDVGAEAGFYAADISRTVPVSGVYLGRPKEVFDAVRRVQTSAIALHKPGISLLDIDVHMQRELTDELASLGLISAKEARSKESQVHLRKYYAHMSHHLGLDLHDVGEPRAVLEPGMVVTCEPGLYLKSEGIGVRLEDDILITKGGHEVLSAQIPSSPEAIEEEIKAPVK